MKQPLAAHDRLEYLLGHSSTVTFCCEATEPFNATYISSNIILLLGFTQKEYLSIPNIWADRIHPDDKQRVFSGLSNLFEKDAHMHEYRWRLKDDSYRWFLNELRLSRGDSGEPIEIVGTLLDITERKSVEFELAKYHEHLEQLVMERTKALEISYADMESYSYSIAHDLRSPLRAIVGFSQILEEQVGERLDSDEKDMLQRIANAGLLMSRLIDDILELSKISRGTLKKSTVNLSDACKRLSNQINESNPEQSIEWRIQEGITKSMDRAMMNIMLQNLLENAWKFTRKTVNACIEVGMKDSDGDSVCYVRDNGCGFNMDYLDKLFLPFERGHTESDYPGTGVGLAIVNRVIQRHGGRIWVESEIDKGATFYFTLG